MVELTNRCSLACVHCSVSEGAAHPHHAQSGYIDTGMVLGLFDDLVGLGARFDTLILFWLGEPLLHDDFSTIYRAALRAAARHRTFGKVEVHTNGTHLSLETTRAVLNSGPVVQVWHFSLDAARSETYLQVKGLQRFEKVENNIARFIEWKGRIGARWPRPVFQFIVGSNNADEVPLFRRRWEVACKRAGEPVRAVAQDVPPGDDAVVFFRQLDCPTPEQQASENAVFRAAMEREGLPVPRGDKAPTTLCAENHAPCSGFWKSPVISWLGDVTTCTRDNLLENRVGSLREARFSELWWGGLMAGRRKRVATGDYSGMPTCASCFIPRSSNYTDLSVEEVERHATFDDRVVAR